MIHKAKIKTFFSYALLNKFVSSGKRINNILSACLSKKVEQILTDSF